jgi:membrane peptidoglycan carboxypeptidase
MDSEDPTPGSAPGATSGDGEAQRRTQRIVLASLRPVFMAIVVGVAAALVAAGLFPLIAGAGAAVKLADSKFLTVSDRALDLPNLPQRSTIYAANGAVLATVYRGQNRVVFPFSAYSRYAKDAVLAIEDHSFYQHGGVDVTSILRALEANLRAGAVVQGGSTITQQLVKNTETGAEVTLQRKIVEAQDAMRLEAEYSKDKIFEAYLNTILLGNSVYGYGTAAGYYFNKSPSDLTLAQAATLAGVIRAPGYYDLLNADRLPAVLGRRNEVLDRMLQYGFITRAEHDQAVAAPIKLRTKGRTTNLQGPEPYWVNYIRHLFLSDPRFGRTLAERQYLWYQGGLKIYTTLNMRIQRAAERSMAAHYYLPTDPQAAAVTINAKTGAVLAMANGNTRYSTKKGPQDTVLNLGYQAFTRTGSAFKIYTLAAALQAGIQPGSVWKTNSPLTIPNCGGGETWTMNNAEGATSGIESLAAATQNSTNVVFAQVINQVGPQAVMDMARRMGLLGGIIEPVCPITLGTVSVSPLAMTAGAQTLANDGVHCMPFAIAKVVRAGRTIFRATPQCARAIPASIASTETSLLEKVICCGTAAGNATLPDFPARPEAGKTGTDDNYKNAYFVGYVPQVVTGVWVGDANLQNPNLPQQSLRGVHGLAGFGADMAAPIWTDIMTAATATLPIEDFPAPPPEKRGTVPNVVGMQKDAATKAIVAASFSPNPVDGPCAQPKGIVCAQTPAGGSSAPLGSLVTFTVSNGTPPPPVQVQVPDVVGQTRDAAVSALQAAKFKVDSVKQDVKKQDQDGIVLSQSPAGGTMADQGSTVTIVVGRYKKGTPSPSPSPGAAPLSTPLTEVVPPLGVVGILWSRSRRFLRRR